jgi:hypothetical protein
VRERRLLIQRMSHGISHRKPMKHQGFYSAKRLETNITLSDSCISMISNGLLYGIVSAIQKAQQAERQGRLNPIDIAVADTYFRRRPPRVGQKSLSQKGGSRRRRLDRRD